MGGKLVRKLFGSGAPRSQELLGAFGELDRAREQRPTLAHPIDTLKEILRCLYEEQTVALAPDLLPEQASAKLAGGVSLLRGEILQLDHKAFHRRWLGICKVMQVQEKNQAAGDLAQALRNGKLEPRELTEELLAGRAEAVYAQAAAFNLDAGLTATVLRLTLFPVLTRVNADLLQMRAGRAWDRGYCPTCGNLPLLGEFRGLEQKRILRCGFCAGEWESPRLRCLFCDETDHRRLGYFHVEGEEMKQKAATCDTCRGYVKMVSTLGPLSPLSLLATDLLTMHLDLAAAERGYGLPT